MHLTYRLECYAPVRPQQKKSKKAQVLSTFIHVKWRLRDWEVGPPLSHSNRSALCSLRKSEGLCKSSCPRGYVETIQMFTNVKYLDIWVKGKHIAGQCRQSVLHSGYLKCFSASQCLHHYDIYYYYYMIFSCFMHVIMFYKAISFLLLLLLLQHSPSVFFFLKGTVYIN